MVSSRYERPFQSRTHELSNTQDLIIYRSTQSIIASDSNRCYCIQAFVPHARRHIVIHALDEHRMLFGTANGQMTSRQQIPMMTPPSGQHSLIEHFCSRLHTNIYVTLCIVCRFVIRNPPRNLVKLSLRYCDTLNNKIEPFT